MKRIIIIVLVLFVILLDACVYSESGIYYTEPIPGDPPSFSVTTNLDTIPEPSVADSLEVIYDAEIANGEFYQVEAYILDELVFNSDTTDGSFLIYTTDVEVPGVDTLSIYFFYSTNSNSLADIFDLEYNYTQLDYAINFEEGMLP